MLTCMLPALLNIHSQQCRHARIGAVYGAGTVHLQMCQMWVQLVSHPWLCTRVVARPPAICGINHNAIHCGHIFLLLVATMLLLLLLLLLMVLVLLLLLLLLLLLQASTSPWSC